MWYYDDGLDYSKPADREYIEKRKQEEREQRIKEAKEERRSYLKGRRGIRYYYDPSKYIIDPYTPKLKCIFTRDLRREKLFAYLKYLNGKKVFVRDLAWKFAVTERTIQSDLKFLIDNSKLNTLDNLQNLQQSTNYFSPLILLNENSLTSLVYLSNKKVINSVGSFGLRPVSERIVIKKYLQKIKYNHSIKKTNCKNLLNKLLAITITNNYSNKKIFNDINEIKGVISE